MPYNVSGNKKGASKGSFIFKVILIGDGAVGKTALIHRFMQGKFIADYLPTIGTQIYTKTVIGEENDEVKLVIWDISGQPAFYVVRPDYYRGTDGVILMFDLTRPDTFEHLDGWLGEAGKHVRGAEMVLVGNKCDLARERKITQKSADIYASKIKAPYFETSAKDGKNVDKAFSLIASMLVKGGGKSPK